ncbi:LytR/AlgR family response regulator transcription factor [Rheinheimera sp. 4Y26]|uniref:LytR/AlgR family response regulator transcription factor n=1 Tax=Rheinheimera sp. 4Y26 TaxID=2977811 RepID=UPI0021B09E30|nr:LytTR family DNA-binding domain-containing protein [Rheinheimera sp. 4Y26]MCT6698405.1 LytTR family DNA-binding domain-containing protein [Rheinheimera sp. 4Y26]
MQQELLKVLLIEDEPLAAEKLAGFIQRYQPAAEIVAVLTSVAEVLAFFEQDELPLLQLIFADIELRDGAVFKALAQLDLPCPVIFTTSYDQYGVQAFSHQAVGYLLKPFTYKVFSDTMEKLTQLKNKLLAQAQMPAASAAITLAAAQALPTTPPQPGYRQRFLLKQGQGLKLLEAANISCIRAVKGILLAQDEKGQSLMLSENNVQQLAESLDPSRFFQLNRSDIIQINFIERLEPYGKENLAVYLRGQTEPLISSKTRTALLRKWLNS